MKRERNNPEQPQLDPKPFDEDELEGDEFEGDDEIIGVAFRRSLQVLAVLALLVGLVLLWIFRPRAEREEVTLEAAAPRTVEESLVAAPELPFTDIAAAAGVDFVHESGASGEKLLPETMGGGAAFVDFDRDGDPDLILSSGTTWPHDRDAGAPVRGATAIYRNDGVGASGEVAFVDITEASGVDTRGVYGTGLAVGDVDGDGLPDLFLAAVGENRLFRNLGEGRFEDVTRRAGVGGDADEWSSSAAFFDLEGDGDLDLFVGTYVEWSREIDAEVDYRLTGVGRAYGPPVNYRGGFSRLYRNDGDATFTEIGEAAGIHVRNPASDVPVGKALGVVPVDFDGDGWTDLAVANDTVANFLFHNQGDGTFREVAESWGLAYGRNGEATGAMGIDAARYRNDDDLGLVIGNFANEMTSVYVAQGDATLFADEAIADGVGAPSRAFLTFGVLWLDADLDGRLDLLETNGHLEGEIAVVDPSQTYAQRAQLFWNAGPASRATFLEVPPESTGDLARPIVGRGSAAADIDGDGDLDLAVTQTGGPALLLRNDQATGHHWLRLLLVDPTGGVPSAEGAVVEVEAGGITQRRTVNTSRSYQSASEAVLTFGLGETDSVERITVRWPDGGEQTLDGLAVDRVHTIERDAVEDRDG